MGKKTVVDERYVNNSYIEKLYNMYLKESLFDKILDVLVFFAILFTVIAVILEFVIPVSETILHYIHLFSSTILLIFAIELIREFAKSKSRRHFIKNHWIDLILVVALSVFFFFSYFGLAKLRFISELKPFFQDAKYTRVIFQIFKK